MRYFSGFLYYNPMAKSARSTAAAVPANFEAALSELEAIVQKMEGGKLSLEDSLGAYQRGMELLKHCQAILAAAEQKIQVLENGQLRELPGAETTDV